MEQDLYDCPKASSFRVFSSGKKDTVVLREASPLSFEMAVTKASSQHCHHTLQGLTDLESKQWQGKHC